MASKANSLAQNYEIDPLDKHGEKDPFTEIGELLKLTREEQNLTQKDIFHMTHIRLPHIESIERGDIQALPGRVYTLGFVKAYAQALNLDADEIVRRIHSYYIAPDFSVFSIPRPLPDQDLPSARLLIFASLLTITVVAGAYLWHRSPHLEIYDVFSPTKEEHSTNSTQPLSFLDKQESKDTSPAMAEAISNSIIPKPMAEEKASPRQPLALSTNLSLPLNEASENTLQTKTIEKVSPLTGAFVIRAKDAAWVDISDEKGKKIIYKVMRAGETIELPDVKGLKMNTGNAGGIEISINNTPLESLGRSGEARKNILLDSLRQNVTPNGSETLHPSQRSPIKDAEPSLAEKKVLDLPQ